jgi:RNA polymerase sigma factor (sigma-70 family)
MFVRPRQISRDQPGNQDIDPDLLGLTQSYLESRALGTGPSSNSAKAWEEFYRVYDRLIRSFALRRGVLRNDLDDCVQEVWGTLLRNLHRFRSEPKRCRFTTWLYTIVARKAIDLARLRERHRMSTLEHIGIASFCGQNADPAIKYEQVMCLQEALDTLRHRISEVNYRLLHMRLCEGCSVGEVCTALHMSPEQVRLRYSRAKHKLRILLELEK